MVKINQFASDTCDIEFLLFFIQNLLVDALSD